MTSTPASCCATRRASRRRVAKVGLAYAPAALLAIVTPKCPMCLAALLGLGFALPGVSYAIVVAVSAAAGTLLLLARWRRKREGA